MVCTCNTFGAGTLYDVEEGATEIKPTCYEGMNECVTFRLSGIKVLIDFRLSN